MQCDFAAIDPTPSNRPRIARVQKGRVSRG
jgi:hypothetical protein